MDSTPRFLPMELVFGVTVLEGAPRLRGVAGAEAELPPPADLALFLRLAMRCEHAFPVQSRQKPPGFSRGRNLVRRGEGRETHRCPWRPCRTRAGRS